MGTLLSQDTPLMRVVSAQPRHKQGTYCIHHIGLIVLVMKAAPDMSIDRKQASSVAVVADAFVFDTVEVDTKRCTNFAAL